MAYFSNGTEGEIYEAHYCQKCVHNQKDHCPVLELHLLWNYEQFDNKDKRCALDKFIKRDGTDNEQCRMFIRCAW